MNPSFLARWNPNQVSGYEKRTSAPFFASWLYPLFLDKPEDLMLWPGCVLMAKILEGCLFRENVRGLPNSGIYSGLL